MESYLRKIDSHRHLARVSLSSQNLRPFDDEITQKLHAAVPGSLTYQSLDPRLSSLPLCLWSPCLCCPEN